MKCGHGLLKKTTMINMFKVVAPMAGICDACFLNKVIPYGFNIATLGGYSLDKATIEASEKIAKRGRREFLIPENEILNHIKKEVDLIKSHHQVKVSANVRSKTVNPIIEVGNIKNLDIVEINCHCRQKEIVDIGCGQAMLSAENFFDFISDISQNTKSEVSVKIRANVSNVDTLKISKLIEDAGADYIHIDAMKQGVNEADWKLLKRISGNVNINVIGNNSVNCQKNLEKMISTGVDGFSIGRSLISGKLDFNIF